MRVPITVVLAALAAAGCNDPVFDVHIEFAEIPGAAAASDLESQTREVIVRVIDAEAAGAAAELERIATCDDIAYGHLDRAVIDGATRTSVSAGRGAALRGVPRLGQKLVLVEALNASGRLYGAGCTPWGDVEGDVVVPVTVEVAPSVRVITRDVATPSSAKLLLTTPWDETLPIPVHEVRTELHTAGACHQGVVTLGPAGVYDTPRLPPDGSVPPPGPATTMVRVRWAEEVVRLPSFVEWEKLDEVGPDQEIALGPPVAGVSRAWAVAPAAEETNGFNNIAATLQRGADGIEEIALLRRNVMTGRIELQAVDAPGVLAVAMVNGFAITVDDGGWKGVTTDGMLGPIPGSSAIGEGPAHEIHVVYGCDGAGPRGIVRRFVRPPPTMMNPDPPPVLTYLAYASNATPGGPLVSLAETIQRNGEQIIAGGCVTIDRATSADLHGVLLSRTPTGALRARLVENNLPIAVPDTSVIATFQAGFTTNGARRYRVAAVETRIDGPRVTAYKIAELGLGGDLAFVSIDAIDSPIAGQPSSIDVGIGVVDGDLEPDVVAALPTNDGLRLQVSLGRTIDREPLSALTPAKGDRDANNGIVRFLDVDPVQNDAANRLELVVLTDVGADIFRMPPPLEHGVCVWP